MATSQSAWKRLHLYGRWTFEMVPLHVCPQLRGQFAIAELDNRRRNSALWCSVFTHADFQSTSQLDDSLVVVLRLLGLLLCCLRPCEADVSAFEGAYVFVCGIADVLSIAPTDLKRQRSDKKTQQHRPAGSMDTHHTHRLAFERWSLVDRMAHHGILLLIFLRH